MRTPAALLAILVGSSILPPLLHSERAWARPVSPAAATLKGEVFDSLAEAPLGDAEVQLLGEGTSASYDARTDSLGQFTVARVAAGTYLVGFFHPRIDSLGIDIPPVRVTISDGAEASVVLAVPARRTIVSAFCPESTTTPETTLLLGYVRESTTGDPVGGAAVSVHYSEVGFAQGGGIANVRRGGITQSQRDGRFAACNLPLDAELVVRAAAGPDTSGALALRFPPNGLLARDVYVPSSGSASRHANATTAAPRPEGPTRLRGRVTNPDGRPIPSAIVTLWGVTEAVQADANGEFQVDRVRDGSTTLEVSAAGHEATRVALDVRTGKTNTVAVVLSRVPTRLAEVKVEASANSILVRNGFTLRREGGSGRFLDADDLAKMGVITTTAALQRLPGTLVRTHTRGTRLFLRDSRGRVCAPTVFVDGVKYTSTAESELDAVVDIDLLADPSRIAGIELYTRLNQAPLQFAATARYGCGIVVIWRSDLARRAKGKNE